MKLWNLICEVDTDMGQGAGVKTCLTKEEAQELMKKQYHRTLETICFDTTIEKDEYGCGISKVEANIQDGMDHWNWRIEEVDLDVKVAVEVSSGLVQNIYSNAGIDAEVYDLDVSGYAEKEELEEADKRAKELNEIVNSPEWGCVW